MTRSGRWITLAACLLIVLAVVLLMPPFGGPIGGAIGTPGETPTARPATPSPRPTPAGSLGVSASPSASASSGSVQPSGSAAVCVPGDQDPYVYHPFRLEVAAACIRVTGVVAEIRSEDDGDLHILLALDAPFAYLLTPANQGVERGDLVVEPICVRSVTQLDAIDACRADPDPLSVLPRVGDYVWMEGRYVFDLEHGGWAELHPLYRWGYQDGTPLPIGSPAPTFTGGGTCDPAYPTVCIPPPPPDLDCGDVPYRRFVVLAPDPHRFDGDHDGIGCE